MQNVFSCQNIHHNWPWKKQSINSLVHKLSAILKKKERHNGDNMIDVVFQGNWLLNEVSSIYKSRRSSDFYASVWNKNALTHL